MMIVSICIIGGTVTYAYYRSTLTGSASGTIARWDFKANNQTTEFAIDLGALYPGKQTTFDIVLSAASSSLDVYYELKFEPGYIPGNFYWDNEKTILVDDFDYIGKYKVIPAGTTETLTIYYDWPYDMIEGEEYDPEIQPLYVNIIGQQYTGMTETIPMNLLNLELAYNPDIANENLIIPIAQKIIKYSFEPIDATSGWIKGERG